MESNSIRKFLKNVTYTFTSNASSFVINALIVLVVPKILGVAEYGYYQLYVLLATYALYFHFGWCDGVYLRYVGTEYKQLDKPTMSAQFKGVAVLSIAVSAILLVAIQLIFQDSNKIWVYSMASIAVLLVTPKTFTSVTMQMTNRMKEYSRLVLVEKVIYAVVLALMLSIGIRNYKILLLSDLIGKFAALVLGIYFCKDIVFCKGKISRLLFKKETTENIRVGIFLLISNLASILITGIVQFSIESKWDIETFSKVSLTFNMSRMLLVVITAMSIVLVPMLKHMDEHQLASMYKQIRSVLMFTLGAMLLLYYPLKVILSAWLPQYSDSLHYMALLFPMCLFESKTQLLINTYLKAMREEIKLCFANVLTVIVSAVVAYITVFVASNLNAAILTIPYLLAFRCIILEFYVGCKLKIHIIRDAFIEVGLATIFILCSWFIDSWLTIGIYFIFYLLYVLYIRKDLMLIVMKLKR